MSTDPRAIARTPRTICAAVAFLAAAFAPALAAAEPATPSPAPPKPLYSVPFQLRPAGVATVLRADTVIAPFEGAGGEGGQTIATLLFGAYKVSPTLAPFVRLGVLRHTPPGADAAAALSNPAVGLTYARPFGELRAAFILGVALPLGTGGGDAPDPETNAAVRSGVYARSGMDNAMFAVNDLTIFPGASVAWVRDRLTVQGEITLLELIRVRGGEAQPDDFKTNFTSGLHVGYYVVPSLSVAAELRHQRYLSTPSFVEADARLREQTTIAAGLRYHLAVGERGWFRPGLSYARGLDDPMSAASYHVVQLDLPLYF